MRVCFTEPYQPRCMIRTLSRWRADVFVHVPGQHVERHVAAEDDGVVEGLEIKLRSERRRRLLTQAIDLAVPDLVAARLPRPRAIPIDFARDLQRVRSVHVDEIAYRFLARP